MMKCPGCGTKPPFWVKLALLYVVGYPCDRCGQVFRVNSRGLYVLIAGACATSVLAAAAEVTIGIPISTFLVAAFGLFLTALAANRFGELVRKDD
jgi:hypothetical protein